MDNLKNILKNGFYPHYCLEYTLDLVDRKAAAAKRPPMNAIPMVCFCDLPLSLIRKHLKEYGNFGIGLDKKWGLMNGLTPVFYTHNKAQTRQPVLRLTTNADKENGQEAKNDLRLLAAYTKPFNGPAWRNGQVKSKVKFYDERELRYVAVPRRNEPLFLSQEDYDNTDMKNRLQKQLKKQNTLSISPDVIQYLIVPYDKDENNIFELHKYLMRLYTRRYSRKDAILVTAAIMTDDRILQDV
jgi:hypothetical protein